MSKRSLIFASLAVLVTAVIIGFFLRPLPMAPRSKEVHHGPDRVAKMKLATESRESNQKAPARSDSVGNGTREGDALDSVPERIPIDQIRNILDKSMAALNGRYVDHQEIVTGMDTTPTVSFLYTLDGEGSLTDSDSIRVTINSVLQKREQAKALMAQALDQGDEPKVNAAGALLVAADRDLVREDEFATIEVATAKDMAPVQMFQKGLPDWMILRETALGLANQHFGQNSSVQELRRAGFGRFIFVCKSDSESLIYVDAREGKVYTQEAVVVQYQRRRVRRSENERRARSERIRRQWHEFLKEGIDVTIFSLDDLEDLSKRGT